jgi:hypothetical protein
MAMRNEVLQTPNWLRVEIRHDPRNFEHRLDIGIKCHDGWAHVVCVGLDLALSVDAGFDKKVELLQRIHEHVTKQLAIATLEHT